MNGLSPAAPPMMPGVQGPVSFRVLPTENPAPIQGPTSALVPANQQAPAGEGEQDALSTAQRSTLKWEKEESLGEMATVAPVLYCNTNFPQLKQQYPGTHTHTHTVFSVLTELTAVSCIRLAHQSEADHQAVEKGQRSGQSPLRGEFLLLLLTVWRTLRAEETL